MQLLAFGGCTDTAPLIAALAGSGLTGVLYEDVNDPRGVALLTFSDDPNFFIDRVRPLLNEPAFRPLTQKPEYTMLGRTYSLGYEPDLVDVLMHRARRTVLNPDWKWAVWYPLRRSGKFAQLPPEEQRVILAEHGAIGMSYGVADYAHDIRLACHGLDKDDNDFVVSLISADDRPLRARRTRVERPRDDRRRGARGRDFAGAVPPIDGAARRRREHAERRPEFAEQI